MAAKALSGKVGDYEKKALRIRKFAGRNASSPVDPFELAKRVGLRVVSVESLEQLSEDARRQLLEIDVDGWSGGATMPLPDGTRLVVLNPRHSSARQSATLMEEVCHVFLGHRANQVGAGKVSGRDHNSTDEEEAYSVGAAVLVPYAGLCEAVWNGKTIAQIARYFRVSWALIEYRLKVLSLWGEYKARH